MAEFEYWKDACSYSWTTTFDIIGTGAIPVVIAVGLLIIGEYLAHRKRKGTGWRSFIGKTLLGAIPVISIWLLIFFIHLFLVYPEHAKAEKAQKHASDSDKKLAAANQLLETVALINGAQPTGQFDEKLKKILNDFNQIKAQKEIDDYEKLIGIRLINWANYINPEYGKQISQNVKTGARDFTFHNINLVQYNDFKKIINDAKGRVIFKDLTDKTSVSITGPEGQKFEFQIILDDSVAKEIFLKKDVPRSP